MELVVRKLRELIWGLFYFYFCFIHVGIVYVEGVACALWCSSYWNVITL